MIFSIFLCGHTAIIQFLYFIFRLIKPILGADGSVRLFDLRSLQHSTILYEDTEKRMLNHIAWNKREHTKLATVAHESFEV